MNTVESIKQSLINYCNLDLRDANHTLAVGFNSNTFNTIQVYDHRRQRKITEVFTDEMLTLIAQIILVIVYFNLKYIIKKINFFN